MTKSFKTCLTHSLGRVCGVCSVCVCVCVFDQESSVRSTGCVLVLEAILEDISKPRILAMQFVPEFSPGLG